MVVGEEGLVLGWGVCVVALLCLFKSLVYIPRGFVASWSMVLAVIWLGVSTGALMGIGVVRGCELQ